MKTEWKGKLFVGILGQAPRAPSNERDGNRQAKPNATAPHLDSTVCNTSRMTGIGKRKIIVDRQLWVDCGRSENGNLLIANGYFLVISSGRLES